MSICVGDGVGDRGYGGEYVVGTRWVEGKYV